MISKFLSLVFAVLFAALAPGAAQVEQTLDVLIRGGRIVDGMGNPWRIADIGIRAGRIAAMGRLGDARAVRVIDAAGLTVTPGFIDVHTHAGPGLAGELNHARPLLAQGITTAVVNPDGGGPVDIATQRANYQKRGTGVNVAMYVPHGSIRREVLAMSDRDPSPDELARMVEMVRQGMKAGAIGLSSGVYYAPASYSKTGELVAMARAAADGGGVYESHIRDEGDYNVGLIASIEEVIRIAEEAGLPGIVAHMKALGRSSWGLSTAALMRMDMARARGVSVYADQYPYEASSTSLVSALVPRWAEVGGRAELLKRLRGPDQTRLASEIRANIERRGGPASLIVGRSAQNPSMEGKSLAEISGGKPPEQTVMDLIENSGDVGVISFNMNETDIEQIMRHSFTMTCTDGDLVPFGQGKPHPRAYGTFPRKLRIYARERGIVDLPFVIRSMTSLPATVFGMKDRGALATGMWADILIFDPEKFTDKATYVDPHQLSQGIQYALVNGELAIDQGRFTGRLPGRIVTPDRR
jgi:N-acyl-D-amino-acid deacylase